MSLRDVRRSTWIALAVFVGSGTLYGFVRPDDPRVASGTAEPVAVVVVTTLTPVPTSSTSSTSSMSSTSTTADPVTTAPDDAPTSTAVPSTTG